MMLSKQERRKRREEAWKERILEREKARDMQALSYIEAVVKHHSGIGLKLLSRRLRVGQERIRTLLQLPGAKERFRMDSASRVHHLHPVSLFKEPRSESGVSARIVENRNAWKTAVHQAWQLLNSAPAEWIANRVALEKKIQTDVRQASQHYLQNPSISDDTKRKAQDVLSVLATLQNARKGETIDPRAFKPFKWPSTQIQALADAMSPKSALASGDMLAKAGYRVGRSGLSEIERRDCLRWLYAESDVHDLNRLPPYSCGRLHRIANAIAYLVRQAKHRSNADMSEAISHWEADMAWMKKCFYDGKCDRLHFNWPTV